MLEQRKIQKPYFGTKNVKLVWERLQTLSALISNKKNNVFRSQVEIWKNFYNYQVPGSN